jgi:hypothetical protein
MSPTIMNKWKRKAISNLRTTWGVWDNILLLAIAEKSRLQQQIAMCSMWQHCVRASSAWALVDTKNNYLHFTYVRLSWNLLDPLLTNHLCTRSNFCTWTLGFAAHLTVLRLIITVTNRDTLILNGRDTIAIAYWCISGLSFLVRHHTVNRFILRIINLEDSRLLCVAMEW